MSDLRQVLQLFYDDAPAGVRSRWRNLDGSWSAEQRLGGAVPVVTGITAVMVPGTPVLHLFYLGDNGSGGGYGVYSRTRNADGSWSAEQGVGGGTLSGGTNIAAVVVPGTEVVQLFYVGDALAVYSRWRNPDGSWSAEQRLGGQAFGFVTAVVVPGTEVVQLFYPSLDGQGAWGVYSRWRNPDGSWSAEQRLGASSGGTDIVAAVVPGTEVLQLFYSGHDDDPNVYSRWRNPDGSWSAEQRLGGSSASYRITAIVVPGTEVLQLFYFGPEQAVHTRWRNPDGSWSGEQSLGGTVSPLGNIAAAVVPGTEVLQLFYRGPDPDRAVYSRWRNPNGSWSGEQRLGGQALNYITAALIPV